MTFPHARLWLVCALSGGCFGGPISDFPQSSEGERPAGMAPDMSGGPARPSDEDPSGPAAPPPSSVGNDNGGGPAAGGDDLGDGDSDGDGDGDGFSGELTPPSQCGLVLADGSCQGTLCGVARSDLESMAMPGGACVTNLGELSLVCDETLSREVGKCTQEALASGSLDGVQECASSSAALDGASDDCIACYVQDNRCMLENCLLDCVLSGAEAACALCRQNHCAEAFAGCSGLPPAPPALMTAAQDVTSP